jgi:hypothetical protein
LDMQFKDFIEAIIKREQEFELIEPIIYYRAIERLRDVQNDVSKLDRFSTLIE